MHARREINRRRLIMFTRKLVSMTAMVGSLLAITAGSALAEGSVKLECWGNCGSVTLRQVCDRFSTTSQPVSIACDDTASPGSSFGPQACGGATCYPYGTLSQWDTVGAYCQDGGGNDAIVTCK
jgi:hypothetical protein